ncbi:MAG: Lrp/AsnC family transcriptional regulator [Hyphomicrobiales bacterium]|nr:Lrp/AsnC family transcriptional regulator [Hyphomicrobiales bacterium]
MSARLDATDRKILALLQEDATLPLNKVAARVNLSKTPCWRRIRKLEESGVIRRRVALLDPQRAGPLLNVFVHVKTGRHSADWLRDFAAAVSAMPEVMEFYRLSGEWDYFIRVMVADIAAYDAFYKKLIAGAELVNVTSSFAMEEIKYSTALPL